jgi:hypothetical protein
VIFFFFLYEVCIFVEDHVGVLFSQLLVLMDRLSDVVLLVCFHVYLFIPVFINFNNLIHALM